MFSKKSRMLAGTAVLAALLTATAVRAEATPSVYWTDQFGGTGTEVGSAIATASNGDVVVYGAGADSLVPGYVVTGSDDLFLARYSKSGTRKWVVQFGSDGVEYTSRTVAMASNGDIVVAGTVVGNFTGYTLAGSSDVFVARFNRNGRQLWLKQFGSAGQDLAGSVAVAPSGDIYLSATTEAAFPNGSAPPTSTLGGTDAVLVKLDRRGTIKWSRAVGTSGLDMGLAVAVSKRNEVYVAGVVAELVEPGGYWGLDDDAFIAQFDRNGNMKWIRQSGATGGDGFYAVATNARGDVYAAGTTEALSGGTVPGYKTLQGPRDGIVVKFDRLGTLQWANQHGTGGSDGDWSIAVAKNGQVYVGGYTDNAWTGYTNRGGLDAYVAHITPAGDVVTARQLGTPGDDANSMFGVAISMIGNSTVAMTSSIDAAIFGHEYAGASDAWVAAIPTP